MDDNFKEVDRGSFDRYMQTPAAKSLAELILDSKKSAFNKYLIANGLERVNFVTALKALDIYQEGQKREFFCCNWFNFASSSLRDNC